MKLKINATYEMVDVERLILRDLAAQGVSTGSATVEFDPKWGEFRVSVAVSPNSDNAIERPIQSMDISPPLSVVDGGGMHVDMSEVLGASADIANQKPPLYPPKQRLMDGESFEYPEPSRGGRNT